MSIVTDPTHPFTTPGMPVGKWLDELEITSGTPAFSFVASRRLADALDITANSSTETVPTPFGNAHITQRTEHTAKDGKNFHTMLLDAEVVSFAQRGAGPGTQIIMVVTQLQPDSCRYIGYARIKGDGHNNAIHDVDVAFMGTVRDALASI